MLLAKKNFTIQPFSLSAIKLKAFTLAEILIAMCIIGIVIEVTVPDYIYFQQKQTAVNKVRMIYNSLEQATRMIAYDCGGDLANCLTNPDAADNDNATRTQLTNLYKQKFAILRDCTNASTTECFANETYLYLNLTPDDNFNTRSYYDRARIVLNNGVAIGFDWNGKTAFPPYYFVMPVDLNNTKDPNRVGKDTFFFYYDINKKAIMPWNINDCGTGTNEGAGCAARIIKEGAINYY